MNGIPNLHLWLLPILPLAGFLVNGLFGRRLPRALVAAVAILATAIPVIQVAIIIARFGSLQLPYVEHVANWITAGSFHAGFTFQLDQLTLLMLCVITGVGFLIHVYSIGYMAHEDGFWRFFAYLNLFMFFMLTLVLANNFLMLFIGWEGVGLASYLLIGFYVLKTSAADAGKKAFIYNRIGDFGFLLAMFLMIQHFGSLSYSQVFPQIIAQPALQGGFLTAIGLLLLLGATGKSAQIPLYVWLPDAMEGPTPVSALIHAATMVTAGVYMVARAHVIFDRSAMALAFVAVIGTATAFFAATMAVAQNDIKRVLAYSTVSQLGYMFLGCGVAAYSAGIFHLVAHAFFKALLFLAAGAVIHSLSGEQDMRHMGGLRKKIPVTFWTMTAAVFAISGFPPLVGFASKDGILYDAFIAPGGKILWFVALVAAGFTSFYMFRLWYMTFFGEDRTGTSEILKEAKEHGHGHIHESPWVMLIPMAILALLSVFGGALGWPSGLGGNEWITHFLAPVFNTAGLSINPHLIHDPAGAGSDSLQLILAIVSTLTALAGWFVAHLMYYAKPELPELLTQKFRAVHRTLYHKYWVDEIYEGFIAAPVLFFSRFVLNFLVDRGVIDGAGFAAGGTAQGLGSLVARIQSGNIRSYAGWLAFGATLVLVVTYFVFTGSFMLH
ncbi:MAG: NADH-quinone oxidoreductase subunit L [Acidobacteriaceae bacterium]